MLSFAPALTYRRYLLMIKNRRRSLGALNIHDLSVKEQLQCCNRMSSPPATALNVDDIAALRRLVQSEGRDARNIVVYSVPNNGMFC